MYRSLLKTVQSSFSRPESDCPAGKVLLKVDDARFQNRTSWGFATSFSGKALGPVSKHIPVRQSSCFFSSHAGCIRMNSEASMAGQCLGPIFPRSNQFTKHIAQGFWIKCHYVPLILLQPSSSKVGQPYGKMTNSHRNWQKTRCLGADVSFEG